MIEDVRLESSKPPPVSLPGPDLRRPVTPVWSGAAQLRDLLDRLDGAEHTSGREDGRTRAPDGAGRPGRSDGHTRVSPRPRQGWVWVLDLVYGDMWDYKAN